MYSPSPTLKPSNSGSPTGVPLALRGKITILGNDQFTHPIGHDLRGGVVADADEQRRLGCIEANRGASNHRVAFQRCSPALRVGVPQATVTLALVEHARWRLPPPHGLAQKLVVFCLGHVRMDLQRSVGVLEQRATVATWRDQRDIVDAHSPTPVRPFEAAVERDQEAVVTLFGNHPAALVRAPRRGDGLGFDRASDGVQVGYPQLDGDHEKLRPRSLGIGVNQRLLDHRWRVWLRWIDHRHPDPVARRRHALVQRTDT